jgi:hypothetical protein
MQPARIDDSGAGKYASELRGAAALFFRLHEAEAWHIKGVETQNGLSITLRSETGDRFELFVLAPTLTLADDIFNALEKVRKGLAQD